MNTVGDWDAERTDPPRSRFVEHGRQLLVLGSELQELPELDDTSALRMRIVDQLKRFEHACREEKLGEEWIMAARFGLCAFLDERILLTPWGARSEWTAHRLTEELHGDADAGNTFFLVLERLLPECERYREVLELFNVILRFGFRGRYARLAGGDAQLAELTTRLGEQLRDVAGGYSVPLSVNWRGQQGGRRSLLLDAPLWAWAAAGLAGVLLLAGVLAVWTAARAAPLADALRTLGGA